MHSAIKSIANPRQVKLIRAAAEKMIAWMPRHWRGRLVLVQNCFYLIKVLRSSVDHSGGTNRSGSATTLILPFEPTVRVGA